MIIHINGMPGVGKFTTALALAKLVDARLIDNHLAIDLVQATVGRSSQAYISMLSAITAVIHQNLLEQSKGENLVFTNALANLPEDEARLKTILQLARNMKQSFVPVLLYCDLEKNVARLTNPDRQRKGKLMNVEILKDLRRNYEIAHDPAHENAFALDTTALSPEQAAFEISRHIKKIEREQN